MQKNDAIKIQISFILLLFVQLLVAQNERSVRSSTLSDSLAVRVDTLKSSVDSLKTDSLSINISKDAIDAEVKYSARDSIESDFVNQKMYLYGGAKVEYTSITLEAGFIELDLENNIVLAEGILDSAGNRVELPHFVDGEQDFNAKRMRYNFETEKGIIYDVTTRQQNLYVLGSKAKFRREQVTAPGTDSTFQQDVVFNENAIFTTCNHPEPHFGIRSQKQKVIPGKLVVVGPSNLEIAGVPTPLYLPFAFFPTTEKRTQGLIFPRGYEFSEQWGFGLRNIGYYVPINEYIDATANFDIYLKGTWGVSLTSNFRRRYKYSGSFNIGYRSNRTEAGDGTVSFTPSTQIRLNYNQAAAAHPTRTFGGSVNIQFSDYQSTNFNDAQSVTQASFNSNLSYRQTFPGRPYSFSAAFTHSQNRSSGQMTINLPNFNFQTQTIYPFKRKIPSNKESWYEKIAFRYQGEARAQFTGADTLAKFFQADSLLNGMKLGARHVTNVNTAFRVFKNINVTPSVRYTNSMNFQYIQERLTTPFIVNDTIFNPADSTDFLVSEELMYTDPIDSTAFGLRMIHEYSASVSLNTALFRTARFKKGMIRGLRHIVKPSVSFNYSPDYLADRFGYYDTYPVIDASGRDTIQQYSIFENSLYRAPSGRQQMAIAYSLLNIYEAKIFSKKDSTEKKIRLMDNLNFSGNYNFAADSLRFSQISGTATTRLFKGLSTFAIRARWDPYTLDGDGRRVNNFHFVETGKLLRFDGASFRLTTNITVDRIRKLIRGEDDLSSTTRGGSTPPAQFGGDVDAPPNTRPDRPNVAQEPEEAILDLFNNFRISHNFNFELDALIDQRDTIKLTTHTISTSGNLQLTPNWSIRVGNIGYDFVQKRVSYPDFSFTRNLHCWSLQFSWQPTRGTYGLSLYVTDSPLNFLRIPYGRNIADGRGRR